MNDSKTVEGRGDRTKHDTQGAMVCSVHCASNGCSRKDPMRGAVGELSSAESVSALRV